MGFGIPLLVTFFAFLFWVAAIAKFDLNALLASFVATIVAATLWLVWIFQ